VGGTPTSTAGLGLLDVTTRYDRQKLLRHGPATFVRGLTRPWSQLEGRTVDATYEIRHGRVEAETDSTPALLEGLGWVVDNVLATTAHGLLEDPDLVAALLGTPPPPSLDDVLDELTAAVVPHLDTDLILTTIGA
jgi:cobyric acid synthase